MSIEEAIDILQDIKNRTACLMKVMPTKKRETAIDMAIDALSEQHHTGKWIKITNTLYKCNRCGSVQLKGNYCKDCEAKMEGVNNEID